MTSDEDLINLSEGRERERDNRDLLNKLLNKRLIIKSFSVKREDLLILGQFMEIARRERKTFEEKNGFSSAVVRAIREYVDHHPLPNPQVTLDRSFAVNMAAKPSGVCCVEACRRKAEYQLCLKDFNGEKQLFHVCSRHFKWRHPRFRFLLSYKLIYTKEKKQR